jgi:hypothetical protein
MIIGRRPPGLLVSVQDAAVYQFLVVLIVTWFHVITLDAWTGHLNWARLGKVNQFNLEMLQKEPLDNITSSDPRGSVLAPFFAFRHREKSPNHDCKKGGEQSSVELTLPWELCDSSRMQDPRCPCWELCLPVAIRNPTMLTLHDPLSSFPTRNPESSCHECHATERKKERKTQFAS